MMEKTPSERGREHINDGENAFGERERERERDRDRDMSETVLPMPRAGPSFGPPPPTNPIRAGVVPSHPIPSHPIPSHQGRSSPCL